MPPELIDPNLLDGVLTVGLVVCSLTLIIGIYALTISIRRIRQLAKYSEMDERSRISAVSIGRAGVGSVVVALAGVIFTWEALFGEFALTNNFFGWLFLATVYAGPLVMGVLRSFELVDRWHLDRL